VKNLINDQIYQVRMEDPGAAFNKGQVVAGSLLPWDGDWYWSGRQSVYDDLPAETIREIKQTFFHRMPAIAYRYCKQQAQAAGETIDRQRREFVEYHGDDLAIYPDGRSMAADMQNLYRLHNEAICGKPGHPARRMLLRSKPLLRMSWTDGVPSCFSYDIRGNSWQRKNSPETRREH
jgi:hypothetical protein